MISIMLKRIALLVPNLIGVSLLCFGLLCLAPGDSAELLLHGTGGGAGPETLENLRKELGQDVPLHERYVNWLVRAVCFDFGNSFSSGEKVTDEIKSRLPATLKLALGGFGFMLMVSVPFGIISALRPYGLWDNLNRLFTIIVQSVPNYLLGLILLWIFALKLGLFQVVNRGNTKDLLLPVATLGLGLAAVYSRLVRERFMDVLGEDYIKLAYAKGLSTRAVLFRHALKNAMPPLVTLWGMSFGYLLGGSIIVENVFSWPGLGQYAVEAILNRDYPVIQFYVVLMALIFMGINLCVDLIYPLLDPALRTGLRRKGSLWRA